MRSENRMMQGKPLNSNCSLDIQYVSRSNIIINKRNMTCFEDVENLNFPCTACKRIILQS